MKVILKKAVSGLGQEKEILEVADGFARNYLIPQGLALRATPSNLQIIEEEKKREVKRIEKEKAALKLLAEKIEASSITITAKAGGDNKLHGSVTSQDIAEALANKGIVVDKRQILLEEPIKNLGIYHITIKLHPEINTTAKVWVIKE